MTKGLLKDKAALKPPLVAVIENHPAVRSGMELVLGVRGCEVVFHERAAGALEFVRQHRPDVVIVDLHLEYEDAGLDAVRQLRGEADTARLPIVVWSSDLEVGRKVADAGFTGIPVLSKFGHGSLLLATLEAMVSPAAAGGAEEHADLPATANVLSGDQP